MVGFSVSFTVTKKRYRVRLPAASCVLQTTGVVPTTKNEGEEGVQTTLRGFVQLSVAEARKRTLAPQLPESLLTVILDGQVITGGVVSLTVTAKAHRVLLPAASCVLQTTRVVPTAKYEPGAGLQTILSGRVQLSVAIACR